MRRTRAAPSSSTGTISTSSGTTCRRSPPVSGVPDPDGAPFIGLLVNFAGELSTAGLAVGSGDVLVYCSALGQLDPADLVDLYWAGRTTLINRHDDLATYDQVFRRFVMEHQRGRQG